MEDEKINTSAPASWLQPVWLQHGPCSVLFPRGIKHPAGAERPGVQVQMGGRAAAQGWEGTLLPRPGQTPGASGSAPAWGGCLDPDPAAPCTQHSGPWFQRHRAPGEQGGGCHLWAVHIRSRRRIKTCGRGGQGSKQCLRSTEPSTACQVLVATWRNACLLPSLKCWDHRRGHQPSLSIDLSGRSGANLLSSHTLWLLLFNIYVSGGV